MTRALSAAARSPAPARALSGIAAAVAVVGVLSVVVAVVVRQLRLA